MKTVFPTRRNVLMNWIENFDISQRNKSNLEVSIIKCKALHLGWIKCNTDEASKGNSSWISYEFRIRDKQGDLIYSEANYIGEATNTINEARVIRKAPIFCVSQDFEQILLETDSLSPRNILQKIWKIPWEIVDTVEEILMLMKDRGIQVEHEFIEANHANS